MSAIDVNAPPQGAATNNTPQQAGKRRRPRRSRTPAKTQEVVNHVQTTSVANTDATNNVNINAQQKTVKPNIRIRFKKKAQQQHVASDDTNVVNATSSSTTPITTTAVKSKRGKRPPKKKKSQASRTTTVVPPSDSDDNNSINNIINTINSLNARINNISSNINHIYNTNISNSSNNISNNVGNKSNGNSNLILSDENRKRDIIHFVTSKLEIPRQMNSKQLLKLVHKKFKLNYSQLSPQTLVHHILTPTLVFYQTMEKLVGEDGSMQKVFTLHYDPDRIYKLPNLKKRKYRHVWRFNHVKSGKRPLGDGVIFEKPLEHYDLPDKIKNVLDNKKILEKHAMNASLKSELSRELKQGTKVTQQKANEHVSSNEMYTFTHNLLETLLHVEEAQMIYDIKQYDLTGIELVNYEEKYRHAPNSKLYKVYCAGLAEKRPSVLRGDLILCRPHHETKAKTVLFKGFIHFVNLDHVVVSFHENVEYYENVDISFRFSRTPIKLMHRALSMCDTPYFRNVFSGAKVVSKSPAMKGSAVKVSTQLTQLSSTSNFSNNLNECQKTALIRLLAKPKIPQLVFGPPGTGKTYLIAQCILEIMKQNPKHKILVCTPSNQAADIIVERLVDSNLNPLVNMMRMNSIQRDPNSFTKRWIIKFSNKLDQGFEIPEASDIAKKDVIISTCTSSGYLYSKGVKPGHFTHIIIDESGESVIPEALIPLSLKDDNTVIVLAGDPKQLGPIVRSPLAVEHGLGESLLEHLVKLGNDCCSITQLQRSYRAHPKIMEVYSSVFYNNSLISSCTDHNSANLFINNPILKNPLVPMKFFHVKGDEKRDNDSPSWYNAKEIQVVMEQLDEIVQSGLVFNTKDGYNYEHEIGIITPYRKQAEEIKKLLRKSTNPLYKYIFVGTTEQFQGQERRVILLTTVRSSNLEGLEQDSKFKLGFLQNPKRLNVAISRAISLMIVVGNAELLSIDEHWKKIINIYNNEQCFIEYDNFTPPSATTQSSSKKSRVKQYNTESLEIKRYE